MKRLITPDLLMGVLNELDAIRTLPLEQRQKLTVENLNPQRYNGCIYARLFGSSLLDAVNKFKKEHNIVNVFSMVLDYSRDPATIGVYDKTIEEFYDKLPIKEFTMGAWFSNLEMYITFKGVNLAAVVAYIRGETDDIDLSVING